MSRKQRCFEGVITFVARRRQKMGDSAGRRLREDRRYQRKAVTLCVYTTQKELGLCNAEPGCRARCPEGEQLEESG